LDLYIDIGTYDIDILIPMVHGLRDILQARGYAFLFREWHEGHSWGNWKGHLKLPLTRFFPYTTGMNETPFPDVRLDPVRPNPFRDHTMIPFSAPAGSNVSLNLVDMSGNTIETIFSGLVPKSDNLVEYHHHKAAGTYILTLKLDGKIKGTEVIQAL
ncbi:MAG: T9SS type A sorting domain-containing protein, partial [Bacteroidota bacterium]